MPAALPEVRPSINSGELAWLATQEDVESRLVFTHGHGDNTHYEVRHGPFQHDVLSSLPRQNWTLLVQDVEKHLPDFRALFAAVDFIPDWRIDDLMVSFAAPGGSVGPHKDNYDVFLCQGEGVREWHLGDKDKVTEDTSSSDLSLLKPFVDIEAQTAAGGDVLYLPPGVPHWGIARDFCMTYSIGMRAPNLAELNAGAARLFDATDSVTDSVTAKSSASGADIFYEDPDLLINEAIPGFISDAAILRAKNLLHKDASLDEQQVAMILGSVTTDPKAWLAPECASDDEARNMISELDRDSTLTVHGMARIAFCETAAAGLIFANGFAREVSPTGLGIFRNLCRFRTTTPAALCADEGAGLLYWLLTSGVFDLTQQHG
jgi:50S ribosomal protein L16 3-hydroxylase